MTLFANSGLAWPKFEEQTQDAGKRSLEAASTLYSVLAAIEGKGDVAGRMQDIGACADALAYAARIYESVADGLADQDSVNGLSRSEFELAAIPPYPARGVPRYYPLSGRGIILGGRLSIELLYRELALEARQLSSSVRALDVNRPGLDVAGSVFQLMAQWESLAVLARVVATLGRRPRTTSG